ncbi:MICOS complex subunit Mic10-like [Amphibalanus amphitrite]|nr:MICOS complex subunit Mic10-like [Amphibalanus amphitrite]
MAGADVRSEDLLGEKWDKCVADTIVKIGGGLAVGAVFSLMFFKRRAWPLTFGLGAGVGMGYANCQRSFDEPYLIRADRVKVIRPIQAEEAGPDTLG